ncbi:MAG: D-threitol dehydrogenase [Synergistaceae bacterium]|jgi:NAD(P)-dependent dehydrogenase (short-subunit alcohol dehydrogenase family)|nr:D-threitol dehydrogenase [Synergistaceae bacterium]
MVKFKDFDKDFSLKDKVFIVTGGAGGIGRVIGGFFSQKGAKGALVDISPKVHETAEKLGLEGIAADLTKPGEPETTVAKTAETFGRLDILVNCAGIGPLAKAEDMPEEVWDRTIAINLRVPFLMAQQAAKAMIGQGGGRIINMASQAGIVAIDGHLAYTTSKAGLIGMTKSMAFEWGKHGITVNAISPTVVNTELSTGGTYWVGEVAARALADTPVGRFGEPEEVAALCAYLASDAAALITGANIVIDGGYTIH